MNARLDTEFREFMRARWPAMVRLAYGLTGDQGHAEDVAQAAFARVYASWPRVRRSGDPDAYVRQIVIRENRDRFRKRRMTGRLTDSLPDTALIDVPWTDVTRERSALVAAFEAISPHPAPVDDTVRSGRAVKRRRAALAIGVVAVAAAAAWGVPSLVHRAAGPAPAPRARPAAVTVQAPGRGAQPGEIATGMINGQRWWIVAALPGTDGDPKAGRGYQDIIIAGPAVEPIERFPTMPVLSAAHSLGPVSFAASISGGVQVLVGAVRADVSRLTVRLDDGSVLTLHPVTVYGTRAVAFAIPVDTAIADVVAYSRHGEIGFTVPFNQPGGLAWFVAWLRPGQHQVPRASGRIASGTGWSATAYLGPWGICIPVVDPQPADMACVPSVTGPVVVLDLDRGGTPQIEGGIAAASVARVVVTQPDGSTAEVRLVTVGSQQFFAFAVHRGAGPLRWVAYDSAGQVVAAGGHDPG
jgi:DNA-directed RNA polymerase specialized sigma24 family protein